MGWVSGRKPEVSETTPFRTAICVRLTRE